jgi:L-ascorbate metabolism protein UlaG (beta-lactamase superfamily)
MKIRWYGHSCFSFTAEDSTRLIVDPFDGSIGYKIPNVDADIVIVSHDHYDHNYTEAISGSPVIVNSPGTYKIKDIPIKGISTYHDELKGDKRGENIVFIFEMDGLKICHLGDLGHVLTREQAEKIGRPDILLIPVGGTFTIDITAAEEVINQLEPKLIIPMHFKTEDVSLPIAPVDDFIERVGGGKMMDTCYLDITRQTLPVIPSVWVMNYK